MNWKVGIVAAMAIWPTAAFAEIAECTHSGGLPEVQFTDSYNEGKSAKVLHHAFTGIEGSAGLGISSIMVMQPDGDGYTLPSLITIDWTSLKFGHGYVPFLQGRENFMLANAAYECVRLD
jgi:hypothetical protein